MIGTKQTFTPIAEDVGKAIGVPRWAASYMSKPWWQVLIEETGAILCNNASWSGSRIIPIPQGNVRHDAFVLSEAYSEYTLDRVCNRDNNGNIIKPDVIIIYRGVNDFSAEDPEGGTGQNVNESLETPNMITFTEITDSTNFTQGYIWTILKLREKYPEAYIILCTLNIVKRRNYSHYPTNNGDYTLSDYSNKIREIANLMGCGLIELDKDGITFENCYPTYISDNATTPTHPNTTGHQVMGEKAIADTKYCFDSKM
jgi:lysophospholipase L1-like esterase